MQHARFYLCVIFCFVTTLCSHSLYAKPVRPQRIQDENGQTVQVYQESHALIIGVSNYQHWPDLPGVEKDVNAVKSILEVQGFNVEVVMNPADKTALERSFSGFIDRYGQDPANHIDNRLLLYFAGHGETVRSSYGGEMGYIVAANAPRPEKDTQGILKNQAFLKYALDMKMIEVYALRMQSKHALFLFDSCFSGSIFSLSRAVPEHISYKTAHPVRQFITSGSADEQVPDTSVFRQQFVAALQGEADHNNDGYITGGELGLFLEDTVVPYSYDMQHPQYGKIRDPNLAKGDFVFVLPQAPSPVTPVVPPVKPSESTFSLAEVQAKAEWEVYQQNMEAAFAEVTAFEQQSVTASLKIEAWQQLLAAFAQNNPYTDRDEELRQKAMQQITLWNKPLTQAPTPAPTPAGQDEWTDPVTGMEFVWIPAGWFLMGCVSGEHCGGDEKPVHTVTLDGFWMGKYEVTQAQWQKVMRSNPSRFKGEDRPVEGVSWYDAQEFIKNLDSQTGNATFRLPTEAEWEYAARAATTTAYSFGNEMNSLDNSAWYNSNSGGQTHPVGQKQPNAWGLYDMHGNVWEWCQDWYDSDYYTNSPRENPQGPASGSFRVLRGGDWGDGAGDCRSAYRGDRRPGDRGVNIGFRLLRTP